MKITKTCEFCGKEFETTSETKKFCDRDHYETCIICGKMFPLKKETLGSKERRKTCSMKCARKLGHKTYKDKTGFDNPQQDPKVLQKMKNTMIERYGVEYAAQNEEIKEKTKKTNLDRYGVEYVSQSSELRGKAQKTLIEHYGVDHPIKSKEIRDKIEKTILEKYGVTNVLASEEIRSKIKDKYKEKTGYEYPGQNPEVQKKAEETNLERYGVKRPLQNKDILEKMYQTNEEKYGFPIPTMNDAIYDKVKKTTKERYGAECYLQSDECEEKRKDALLKKYGIGIEVASQSREWLENRMSNPSMIDNLMKFREDPALYIDSTFQDGKVSLEELGENIGLNPNGLSSYIFKYNLQDHIKYVYSKMEDEVYEFLQSLDLNTKIQRNTKRIITPYELDIYLPEYKFGIECNPTSTHNSSIYKNNFESDTPPVSPSYHKMKTDLCKEKDIFLFHIFGYDWIHKRSIIESMIKNILHKNDNKIYARNTEIKLVDSKESREFLILNHRQGPSNSPIRLGLYYNNKLISLMTFSHPRSTIGKFNDNNSYELVRFCNMLGTSVVGGASKLFKYFLNTYNPSQIISFSDCAHTKGSLYQILGFKEIKKSEPGYVWVNYYTEKSYHRINSQKRNIKKFLKDNKIDLSQPESEIMVQHNFVQVFDSGTITWEWTK